MKLARQKAKYGGVSVDKRKTSQQLALCSLDLNSSVSDYTNHVWISGCTFMDSYDAPIAYQDYGTHPTHNIYNDVNWNNCRFLGTNTNNPIAPPMIDSNKNKENLAIQMYVSNCKSYNYTTAVCCTGVNVAPLTVSLPGTSPYTGDISTLHLVNYQLLATWP